MAFPAMTIRGPQTHRVLSIATALAVAAAPVAAEQARAPAGGLVSVGQSADFSHIEFKGGAQVKRDGQTILVTLAKSAQPDVSHLTVDPPKWLKSATSAVVGGRLQLTLTLADDADAKSGAADGAAYINLFAKPPAPPASS